MQGLALEREDLVHRGFLEVSGKTRCLDGHEADSAGV
jgi:hypothetical protein